MEEQDYALLKQSITKQPLNREVYYKILDACRQVQRDEDIEEQIRAFPEFKSAVVDEYSLLKTLVRDGGLEMNEYDDEDNLIVASVDSEDSEDSEADEADEAKEVNEVPEVAWRSYQTSVLGQKVLEDFNPRIRLNDLLGLLPARKEFYLKVLDFCNGEKRTYEAIESLLNNDLLKAAGEETFHIATKPSVFVDKLERAGGIFWNDGWSITETGKGVLQVLSKG